MATSLSNHHRPIFKLREMSGPDTPYWYVEAEWADGTSEHGGSGSWNGSERGKCIQLFAPGMTAMSRNHQDGDRIHHVYVLFSSRL
jgi:hypothetical protein